MRTVHKALQRWSSGLTGRLPLHNSAWPAGQTGKNRYLISGLVKGRGNSLNTRRVFKIADGPSRVSNVRPAGWGRTAAKFTDSLGYEECSRPAWELHSKLISKGQKKKRNNKNRVCSLAFCHYIPNGRVRWRSVNLLSAPLHCIPDGEIGWKTVSLCSVPLHCIL